MTTAPTAPFWRRPRWIAGHLMALTLVAMFVTFGLWQLRRFDARRERNALIEARMALPAQPLGALLAEFGADPEALAWRRALARGRYDVAREVLLRNRPYAGQAGWHLVTPLRLEDGSALLVERGWVPFELDLPPVAAAAPPEVEVEVVGLLQLEQDPPTGPLAALAARDPPEGELRRVAYVDADRLGAQMPYDLEPVYLVLAAQQPPQAGDLPVAPPPPELSNGSHLSYAVQWFSFALIGIVGYALLLRGVAREEREGRPAGG